MSEPKLVPISVEALRGVYNAASEAANTLFLETHHAAIRKAIFDAAAALSLTINYKLLRDDTKIALLTTILEQEGLNVVKTDSIESEIEYSTLTVSYTLE